jgi:hypothetical protein
MTMALVPLPGDLLCPFFGLECIDLGEEMLTVQAQDTVSI